MVVTTSDPQSIVFSTKCQTIDAVNKDYNKENAVNSQ
jgi:hypothetical protein